MTTSEVLSELRRFYPDFEAMWDAIGARRSEMFAAGRFLGSVAAAHELLEERQSAGGASACADRS